MAKNKKENLLFFGKYQKYFISSVEISAVSLVLRTREITDISTYLKIYIWYSPKKSNYPLYILTVLAAAIYYIATHPDVDKKLFDEIKNVLGHKDVKETNISDLV